MANIGHDLTPTTFYYASRWQLNGGPYKYGGYVGGFWDGTTNVSGVLTIQPANDECTGARSITAPSTDFVDPGVQYISNATLSSESDEDCIDQEANNRRDLWYEITTNGNLSAYLDLTVTPTPDLNVALTLYSGTCGSLDYEYCQSEEGLGGAEHLVFYLSPGGLNGIEVRDKKTYYLRVTDVDGGGTSFTITDNGSTALPVNLLSFKAQLIKQGKVLLDWRVKDEVGMKQYVVERSTDAKLFAPLGTITSLGKERYSLIDPLPAEGINYYRLMMLESSGLTTYSHIAVIDINDGKSLHVSPNPVTRDLTIEVSGEHSNQAMIDIFDLTGNRVREVAIPAGKINIDMSKLPAGIYMVQYVDGTTAYKTKVAKM